MRQVSALSIFFLSGLDKPSPALEVRVSSRPSMLGVGIAGMGLEYISQHHGKLAGCDLLARCSGLRCLAKRPQRI